MGAPLDPHKRYLIVNADDLGLSRSVNRAIFEAHEHGIVTSASLMAVGNEFDEAVSGALSRPTLDVGVHLALHEERPAQAPERIPDLVGPDGRMKPLGAVTRALLFGRIPREQIEAEYSAQIERVLQRGLRPSHLDSHCHLHALPSVARILHGLGQRYGIACARRPSMDSLRDLRGAPLARLPVSILITLSNAQAPSRGPGTLRSPDHFVGLLQSGDVDRRWLERTLARLARGQVSELMVHPSDGTDAGNPHARYGAHSRRAEFEAVTSPEIRAALERLDVELVDYRFLAAR